MPLLSEKAGEWDPRELKGSPRRGRGPRDSGSVVVALEESLPIQLPLREEWGGAHGEIWGSPQGLRCGGPGLLFASDAGVGAGGEVKAAPSRVGGKSVDASSMPGCLI